MPLFLINFCLDMYLTVAPPLHNSGRYQDFEFIQATIRSGGKPPIFTLFMTYSFDLMQQSNDFVTKPRSVQEYTLESIKDGTLCFLEIGTMVSETSKSVTFSLVSFVVSFESCPQKRPIRKPKFQDEFLVTRFLIFFIIITANSRKHSVLQQRAMPRREDELGCLHDQLITSSSVPMRLDVTYTATSRNRNQLNRNHHDNWFKA